MVTKLSPSNGHKVYHDRNGTFYSIRPCRHQRSFATLLKRSMKNRVGNSRQLKLRKVAKYCFAYFWRTFCCRVSQFRGNLNRSLSPPLPLPPQQPFPPVRLRRGRHRCLSLFKICTTTGFCTKWETKKAINHFGRRCSLIVCTACLTYFPKWWHVPGYCYLSSNRLIYSHWSLPIGHREDILVCRSNSWITSYIVP